MNATGRRLFQPASTLAAVLGLVSLTTLGGAGCHLGTQPVSTSPLRDDEMEEALLDIAPLGTPRDEAVQKLTDAGVEGSFGISDSVYYCDVWKRSSGMRWHMNLALLFDESGKLYATRPAQSATSKVSAERSTGGNEPPSRHSSRHAQSTSSRHPRGTQVEQSAELR